MEHKKSKSEFKSQEHTRLKELLCSSACHCFTRGTSETSPDAWTSVNNCSAKASRGIWRTFIQKSSCLISTHSALARWDHTHPTARSFSLSKTSELCLATVGFHLGSPEGTEQFQSDTAESTPETKVVWTACTGCWFFILFPFTSFLTSLLFFCRWKMSAKTRVWMLERTMREGNSWSCIHVTD